MRIAIDALGIDKSGGGRTSVLNLLTELFLQDKKNEYVVFLTCPEPSFMQFSNKVVQRIIPIQNRFMVRLVAQSIFLFEQQKYDLIHFSKNLGLFGLFKPYIVTIHDLTTILHPDLFPKFDWLYWNTLERITIKSAKKVTTVSYNAAKDIIRFYRVPDEKVHVIYHGYSSIFHRADEGEIKEVLEKYKLPEKYFLHVGRIDIKKNLSMLVEGFEKFIREENFPGSLVLVGRAYRKSPDKRLYEVIDSLNIKDRVIFTGFIPDDDLPAVYSGALACVFPSVHEGFGLFALEAMACGVPLIVNKAGALEEIVGNAGIVLPECTREYLAKSMTELYKNVELQRQLRDLGITRAKKFSWKLAASQLLEIYKTFGAES